MPNLLMIEANHAFVLMKLAPVLPCVTEASFNRQEFFPALVSFAQ